VANFAVAQFAVDLPAQRAVAVVDDAAPAAATAHAQQLTAVSLFLLLLAHLLHRASATAQFLDLGPCRVLAARAKDLHAVPMAALSRRDELVRLAWLLQPATAPHVLRLPQASPLLRAATAPRACLFHAHLAPANRLTRGPALHPAPHDPLRRLEQAHCDPRRLDLSLDPAPGCLPRERQHELAAEFSSDPRI